MQPTASPSGPPGRSAPLLGRLQPDGPVAEVRQHLTRLTLSVVATAAVTVLAHLALGLVSS